MSLNEINDVVTIAKKTITLSFIIVMISSYLIAMILGPLIIFFTESGRELINYPIKFDFFIIGLPDGIPMEFNAGLGFIFCWTVYWVAFVASYFSGETFHKLLRKREGYTEDDLTKNFLFSMPIITSLLYTGLVTLILVQLFLGVQIGPTLDSKDQNQLITFFHLTFSPITEEIGFRLIPLGILTAVSLLVIRRKKPKKEFAKISFLSFLFPDKAKEVAGLKNVQKFGFFKGIAVYEWIGILVAAIFFGFAHYYFGAWNVDKIVTSTIFGAALGFAYLIYGIHASILMHWWFNYYSEAYVQAYLFSPSIPWVSITNFLWLTILISGSIGWVLISRTN